MEIEMEIEVEDGSTSTCTRSKRELPHSISQDNLEPCASKRRVEPAPSGPGGLILVPGLLPFEKGLESIPLFGKLTGMKHGLVPGATDYQRLYFTQRTRDFDVYCEEETIEYDSWNSIEQDQAFLEYFACLVKVALPPIEVPDLSDRELKFLNTKEEMSAATTRLFCIAKDLLQTRFPILLNCQWGVTQCVLDAIEVAVRLQNVGRKCWGCFQVWKKAVVEKKGFTDGVLEEVFHVKPDRVWPWFIGVLRVLKNLPPETPDIEARKRIEEHYSQLLAVVIGWWFDLVRRKIALAKEHGYT